MKSVKAVALLSGGLDSTLATLQMKKHGIEVYGLSFITPFTSKADVKDIIENNLAYYENLEIPVKIKELSEEYIGIVRKPRFGYGKNLNPCIDCKILFLKIAASYMKEIGAEFVITGEVLDQRPMSQKAHTLFLIEEEAGMKNLVVRPLSGALLPPTEPELRGLIKREWLLSIRGRQRNEQLKLAEEFGVKEFKQPAGGCLLTSPDYAKKVKDLIIHDQLTKLSAEFLKFGRHFRVDGVKLIVGRNFLENERILKVGLGHRILIFPVNTTGPTALVDSDSPLDDRILDLVLRVVARYCDKKMEIDFKVVLPNGEHSLKRVEKPLNAVDMEKYKI